jgi:hypothetical protein
MTSLKEQAAKLGAPRVEGTETVGGKDAAAIYFGSTKMNNNFDWSTGSSRSMEARPRSSRRPAMSTSQGAIAVRGVPDAPGMDRLAPRGGGVFPGVR